MPPKKTTAPTVQAAETPTTTTSSNQEAQATGHATIIELPPSPPPGLTSPQVDFNEAQPADLTAAITLLTQSLSSPKKSTTWIKVCKLDVFDRSDTDKLQPFLVQCTLNFHNRPDAFTSDSDKVTFALSYLKGTTLDWFEPSLTSGESLPWLNDYSDFVRELKNTFRPHDPKGEAQADLKNLKMRDNQHIVKYLVDFNFLAACVQWGNAADKCITDFRPASRTRLPTSANLTPSTNSVPSPSPSTPDIGSAAPR